jgi:hypothetical protein
MWDNIYGTTPSKAPTSTLHTIAPNILPYKTTRKFMFHQ